MYDLMRRSGVRDLEEMRECLHGHVERLNVVADSRGAKGVYSPLPIAKISSRTREKNSTGREKRENMREMERWKVIVTVIVSFFLCLCFVFVVAFPVVYISTKFCDVTFWVASCHVVCPLPKDSLTTDKSRRFLVLEPVVISQTRVSQRIQMNGAIHW